MPFFFFMRSRACLRFVHAEQTLCPTRQKVSKSNDGGVPLCLLGECLGRLPLSSRLLCFSTLNEHLDQVKVGVVLWLLALLNDLSDQHFAALLDGVICRLHGVIAILLLATSGVPCPGGFGLWGPLRLTKQGLLSVRTLHPNFCSFVNDLRLKDTKIMVVCQQQMGEKR